MTQEILAARLKDARIAAGLTQQQVAEAIFVTRTAISKIEAGKQAVSTLQLASFAYLYNRMVSSFFDED